MFLFLLLCYFHTSVKLIKLSRCKCIQLELHPSPLVVYASLQVSEPERLLSAQVATHDVFLASGDNPAEQADHESDDDVEPLLQINNLVLLLAFIPIVSELADLHQEEYMKFCLWRWIQSRIRTIR